MNLEWTKQEELDEERYLLMQEAIGQEQCESCSYSFRCETQCMNEGDCDQYEEIFDR